MNVPPPRYVEAPWPVIRNAVVTLLRQHRPHTVYGAAEVDVTEALERIGRTRRALGMAVSFHAFVLYCLAQAAAEVPGVLTYRRRDRLITFEEADVGTVLEKRLAGGVRIPVGYVVRAADRKSLAAINWELRQAARSELAGEDEVRFRRRMARMPGFVRRLVSRRVARDPFLLRRVHGTIGLTNVQTRGFGAPFWAFPPNIYTVTVAVGNVTERLVRGADGAVRARKVLCLTSGADHAVIDGMALSHFAQRLTQLLEAAHGLDAAFEEASRSYLEGEMP